MLIQDVRPLPGNVPAYLRGYGKQGRVARRIKTDVLISELYRRGITIEQVFGQYYAITAMVDAKDDEIYGNDEEGQHGRPPLTVGDARLAGYGLPKINYKQPL